MSESSLSVNSNVTIHCVDKYGKIIRTSRVHNKATSQMVQGLLMFLRGDFNPTLYNYSPVNSDSSAAIPYIPVEIRLGNPGVKLSHTEVVDEETGTVTPAYNDQGIPVLEEIDPESLQAPSFTDYKLSKELQIKEFSGTPAPFKFESTPEFTTYNDMSDSLGIRMRAYFSPGELVRFKTIDSDNPNQIKMIPYTSYNLNQVLNQGRTDLFGWSYWNQSANNGLGEWETIITELGIYSMTGILLARVVLDGEVTVSHEDETDLTSPITGINYLDVNDNKNPIIQSESSSIVIEWKIGIVSIGQESTT